MIKRKKNTKIIKITGVLLKDVSRRILVER